MPFRLELMRDHQVAMRHEVQIPACALPDSPEIATLAGLMPTFVSAV